MRLVVVSIVALLGACETPPAQEREAVATALCQCIHATAATVQECVMDVDPLLPPAVPDDCLTCVYTNSQMCSRLLAECVDLCFQQPQP